MDFSADRSRSDCIQCRSRWHGRAVGIERGLHAGSVRGHVPHVDGITALGSDVLRARDGSLRSASRDFADKDILAFARLRCTFKEDLRIDTRNVAPDVIDRDRDRKTSGRRCAHRDRASRCSEASCALSPRIGI